MKQIIINCDNIGDILDIKDMLEISGYKGDAKILTNPKLLHELKCDTPEYSFDENTVSCKFGLRELFGIEVLK